MLEALHRKVPLHGFLEPFSCSQLRTLLATQKGSPHLRQALVKRASRNARASDHARARNI